MSFGFPKIPYGLARFAGVVGGWLPFIPYTEPAWFPWKTGEVKIELGEGWEQCCDSGLGPQTQWRLDSGLEHICRVWGCGNLDLQTGEPLETFDGSRVVKPVWNYINWVIQAYGVTFGRSQVNGERMVMDNLNPYTGDWPRMPANGGIEPTYEEIVAAYPYMRAGLVKSPPVSLPVIDLGFLPMVDPMHIPINQPTAFPNPKPLFISPPPLGPRDPLESNESSYPPNVGPEAPTRPTPWVPPYEVPSIDIPVWPPGAPAVGGHNNLPPGRNEKERKTRRSIPARLLLNSLTESSDIIDAFYKSIPAKGTKRRWKGRDGKWREAAITPQDKLLFIFKNAKHMDLDKAIDNLVENELEDRVIGGLSRRLKDTYQTNQPHGGLGIGYQAGPAL